MLLGGNCATKPPPSKDYGGRSTEFETESFKEPNVHYTKGAPESWADIVRREPILKPEAGILPEYWAKKPNIVEE